MCVVTISREFGSANEDFSAQVARRLNYHFVDKEFTAGLLDQYGMAYAELRLRRRGAARFRRHAPDD